MDSPERTDSPSRPRDRPAPSLAAEGRPNFASDSLEPIALGILDVVLPYAIEEDLGPGDLTGDVLIPQERRALGRLVAKAEGVAGGLDIFGRIFELIDDRVRVLRQFADGDLIRAGDVLVKVEGPARELLIGERVALNFVQRLSGIATRTQQFVQLAEGRVTVYDTRKTTPGFRQFEKYAVLCGGGENHRFGLFDEVMVKNNHVDLRNDSLVEMLYALRATHGDEMRITAEARNEIEALDAITGGADVVMLDNMSVEFLRELCPRLRRAASDAGRSIEIEVSGGVTLDKITAIAGCGVDRVSIGELTHSAPALDMSFPIEVLP